MLQVEGIRVEAAKSDRPGVATGLSIVAGLITVTGYVSLGSFGETAGLAGVALIAGAAMLVGAILLYAWPQRHETVGVVVIAASALALYAYGWLVLVGAGVAFGLAAGITAVQWNPRPSSVPGLAA